MQPEIRKEDSDSEDDPDYVPPAEDPSSSSDEEPEAKRLRTGLPQLASEDQAEKKKTRDALWAEFQASVANPLPRPPEPVKTVKIVKRFRYAGEDIVEVKEVPEDLDDAKKWPLWKAEDVNDRQGSGSPSVATADISTSQVSAPHSGLEVSSSGVPITTSPSCAPGQPPSTPTPSGSASDSTPKPIPKPATKRPGPRKPKVQLAPLPGKAKKLTTLDKSAMDWRSHVEKEQESGLKDELEAHRRGGGYLEKVEFLQRVEMRKEEALEASKSAKRRR